MLKSHGSARKWTLGLWASVLMVGATPAAGDERAPLVRYRVILTEGIEGKQVVRESLVFRDGLLLEQVTDGSSECTLFRKRLSDHEMDQLKATLAANRVGVQSGSCASDDAPGEYHIERVLTWFGRGNRQNTYVIGTALGPRCPSDVLMIDRTIQTVLATASDGPSARACLN
jgi:hypothetical protein